MFLRVKGTQDFLDLTLFNFIVDNAKRHLLTYHFTEVTTPLIEYAALFKRSLGIYTDVVSKEMFIIAAGEHEEETMCLRPEATASVARAFVENNVTQTPWKVFTYGPMFRYERPQKGRYREFNQVSIEVIGSASVAQDAHMIKMLDRFFHERLMINNYALLINYLGCVNDRRAYEVTLKKFLDEHSQQICQLCLARKEKNLLRIFDCKEVSCQQIYKSAPKLTDALCSTCSSEWQELQTSLDLLSVSYIHKSTLVRGLDYYNKTVFEFVSQALGSQSTFCAGGRYDQLVALLGAHQDQPSIGAAMGIERLMLIMQATQQKVTLPQMPPLHVILPLTKEQHMVALLLADELQAQDVVTEVLLEDDSIKSMMRKANKLGANYCLIIGEDEQRAHEVTIKNMVNGQEQRMAQVDVVTYLKG